MRRGTFVGAIGIVGAVIIAVGASSAGAAPDAFICTGNLASGTYKAIIVPKDATCDGTNATITVRGGVTVREGGTFILGSEGGTGGGTISGGVDARFAADVELYSVQVNGGVSIRGGGLLSLSAVVEDSDINGGATIRRYAGSFVGFIGNTVHGTVIISKNTVDQMQQVSSNTIRGDLICHNNIPAPGLDGGSPNEVSGSKVAQCAGL